jgi:hypothetical protein
MIEMNLRLFIEILLSIELRLSQFVTDALRCPSSSAPFHETPLGDARHLHLFYYSLCESLAVTVITAHGEVKHQIMIRALTVQKTAI